MIHRSDVLRDDRALIEFSSDVVRRGADQLHTPLPRLVVGLRTLETREERVVDVDRPPCETIGDLRAQDLHVPGENDEIDAMLFDEREQLLVRRRSRIRRYGDVAELDAFSLDHASLW